MFKGAVEGVTQEAAFGWMYSSSERLRDRLVLAFHRDRCIGAGRIEHYREDLANAGLGDGYLGYHFNIDSPGQDALGEVVIRLEGSDALFMQPNSRVVGAGAARDLRLSERDLAEALSSLKWRLSHNLLEQPEYDYLRSIWQFGVYERIIRRPAREGDAADLPASKVASQLMSVYKMDDVEAESIKVSSSANFEAELARMKTSDVLLPIIGLWSEGRGNLRVLEGSHVKYAISRPLDAAVGIGYAVKPEQLLLLDVRVDCALEVLRGDVEIFVGAR